MPGVNSTGLANTDDLFVGRGILYVSGLDNTSKKPDMSGYQDLGNCIDVKVSVETEFLEHYSSRSSLKKRDKYIIKQQKATLAFAMEEANFSNLARFLSGDVAATITNAAVAGFTEYKMIDSCVKGRWYPLIDSTGVRAYDVAAGDLTVEKSGGPDVAMVLGTDYLLDSPMGMIFLLTTGVVIVNGDDIDVTLAAAAGAKVPARVNALTGAPSPVALKIITANPAADGSPQYEWEFSNGTLIGNGDLNLITDEWGNLPVTFGCQEGVFSDGVTGTLRVTTHTDAVTA